MSCLHGLPAACAFTLLLFSLRCALCPAVSPPKPKTKQNKSGLGGNPAPKRDLRRFVKWPKYVRIQRQRRVLSMRLKVRGVLCWGVVGVLLLLFLGCECEHLSACSWKQGKNRVTLLHHLPSDCHNLD